MREQIWKTLNEVEKLFSRNDVHSASREDLEQAVLIAHDGLNAMLEIVGES